MNRPRLTFTTPVLQPSGAAALKVLLEGGSPMDHLLLSMEQIGREAFRHRHRSAWHREQVRRVWQHIARAWDLAAIEGNVERARLLVAENAMFNLTAIHRYEEQLGVVERVNAKKAASAAKARASRSTLQVDTRTDTLKRAAELRRRNPALSNRAIANHLKDEVGIPEGTIRRWLARKDI